VPAAMPMTIAAISGDVSDPSELTVCSDPLELTAVNLSVVKLDSVDCAGGSHVAGRCTEVESGAAEECLETNVDVTAT